MRGQARNVTITEHAVDRFVERWRPNLPRHVARRELEAALANARFVEYLPDEGVEIWSVLDGALLVIADDDTVRTVLPRDARRTNRRPLR